MKSRRLKPRRSTTARERARETRLARRRIARVMWELDAARVHELEGYVRRLRDEQRGRT